MRFCLYNIQMQEKVIYGAKSQDNDYPWGGSVWKGTPGGVLVC